MSVKTERYMYPIERVKGDVARWMITALLCWIVLAILFWIKFSLDEGSWDGPRFLASLIVAVPFGFGLRILISAGAFLWRSVSRISA